jgi:hypothetical protein
MPFAFARLTHQGSRWGAACGPTRAGPPARVIPGRWCSGRSVPHSGSTGFLLALFRHGGFARSQRRGIPKAVCQADIHPHRAAASAAWSHVLNSWGQFACGRSAPGGDYSGPVPSSGRSTPPLKISTERIESWTHHPSRGGDALTQLLHMRIPLHGAPFHSSQHVMCCSPCQLSAGPSDDNQHQQVTVAERDTYCPMS